MLSEIIRYFPARSLLFLLFAVVLMLILIRPSARLCFWKRRKEDAEVERTGFKRFSRIAALLILVFSLVSMAAGLYVPSVPLWMFYTGYTCIWVSFPFMAGARSGLRGFLTCIPTILLFLFFLSAFIVPVPVIEKEYPVRIPKITEEDDKLQDKNPAYLMAFTEKREGQFGDLCYFNKSVAVVGLDLSEVTRSEEELTERIYPTFRAAKRAAESFECDFLPSVDLVDGFTKYFDDRVLAALEEYIHSESSIFASGKQGFLQALLREVLKGREGSGRLDAAAYLAAAIELGGGQRMAPKEVLSKASSYKKRFLKDPRNSRAVGFYTKSETLEKVFQRDRFLQKPFGTKFWGDRHADLKSYEPEGLLSMIRIAEVLQQNPNLLKAYSKFRRLAEKVCNPEANLNVEHLLAFKEFFEDEDRLYQTLMISDAWKEIQKRGNVNPNTVGVAFWPFSYSKESRLMARLYQAYELPKTEVMNDLVVAIKDGRVDLAPESDSGWYDYQLHALETLVLPGNAHEADKLLLHAKYKKRLREAFEAMLTKRRETHVKELFQVMTLGTHIEPLPATPELSLEPMATHYLRTARAYRFLAEGLHNFFTEDEMSNVTVEGFDAGLLHELNDTIAICYGLYLTACNDLGMVPKIEPKEIASLRGLPAPSPDEKDLLQECFIARIEGLSDDERTTWVSVWKKAKHWLQNLDSENFIDEDVRVIVPVLSNYSGTKVRNWAVLGTRLLKIKAYYAKPPKVAYSTAYKEEDRGSEDPEKLLAEDGNLRYSEWQPKDYAIPVQVFAEVTLGAKPLTREEFRKICNRYETKEEIIEALTVSSQRANKLLIVAVVIVVGLLVVLLGRRVAAKRTASASQ